MNKKRLTAYLLLYNFIGYTVAVGGWLWEVLIFLVTEQRFVNRGFFHGPYLPVYGAGAVLLSVLFYQKRIAVIVTYAHLNQTDYPQDFYHSRLYARLRGLIYLIRRKRFARLRHPSDSSGRVNDLADSSSRVNDLADLSGRINNTSDFFGKINNTSDFLDRVNHLSDFFGGVNDWADTSSRLHHVRLSLSGPSHQPRRHAANRRQHNPGQLARYIRIFFLSLCGGSLTELGVGWLLWHVFRRKYWDYSGYPLNLAGYVCLFSAVGFGVIGVVWMKWVGPFLICMWERVPFSVQILMIGLADLVLVTDAVFSLMEPNGGESVTFSYFLSQNLLGM